MSALLSKGNLEDWIEENKPENSVFRAYWSGSADVTLDSEEGGNLRYEIYFKDGKRADGISKGWYADGQLKTEYTWKDNKHTGRYTWWYLNGNKKVEGNFDNNSFSGSWINFSPAGTESYEIIYKYGLPWDGDLVDWSDHAELDEKAFKHETYKDGKLWDVKLNKLYTGKVTTRHSGGEMRKEATYKDGVLDGPFTKWWPISDRKSNTTMYGNKMLEGLNKDGKKIGTWRTYKLDGSVATYEEHNK